MAARYWVGGTDTWDATAGTKWALTSGGAGGQAVPTSSDDVFFDAASGANTVTIGATTAICSTLTMTGFTGVMAFGSNSINLASTGTIYTGATTFSVSGTPLMLCTSSVAANRAVILGATTEANSISFNVTAGSTAFAANGSLKDLTFSGTFIGSLSNSARTIYGNLTFKTGMTISAGASTTVFAATSGTQTITSAALNLDFPITFSGTATYQLQDALSVGTTTSRTITLTNGTLDLNNKTLTNFGIFSSSNTNIRSILFGTTGNLTLTNTATVTILDMTIADNFTYTGTSAVNLTGNSASGITRTVRFGNSSGATEANALNFTTTAGQVGSIVSWASSTLNCYVRNLIFTTGFAGSLASNGRTIYGNFTCSSTMSHVSGTGVATFSATSGTQQITLAGTGSTFDSPVTFNGTATYQLQDAFTTGSTRFLTLQSGTLDLNNNSLTCGFVSSNYANTRSIAFGTGQIYATGNSGSVYTNSTAGGFTATGTKIVNCTYTGSTGTRTISSQGTAEADMINFKISAGQDIFAITGSRAYGSIEFTSGFTGTINNTNTAGISIYGDVTLPPSPAIIGTAFVNRWTLVSATVNQTFTTNGQTVQFEIAKQNGTTASLILGDDLNSTQQVNLTSGTFNSNGKNITCSTFGFVNSNTKTLTLANSTVTITAGTSSSGFNGSNTGTTYNITSATVIFTTSGTALFNAGGNTTFPAVTMSGTGQLIIGQAITSPTITTLSNTVQPCTISLLSTITRLNVTNFNLSGAAGNLVTLNSSVAGTQANIRKTSGTVNAQYMYIQDSLADGGATWIANPAINGGNNTGWVFSGPAIASRLTNTGVLYANGQFDEVTQTTISTTYLTLYSAQFDEVTLNGQPSPQRRELSTGVVQVNGYFDETGGPLT